MSSRSAMRRATASLRAFLVLLPVTLYGQATSGTITGLVTDPSGGIVVNAKVTITEVNKGVSFTANTNDQGYYTKALIPAGVYKVAVEAPGFQSSIRENVRLSVDTTMRVDFGLTVGPVTETIVVTDQAPLLKSERADVTSIVETRLVTQLPALGRNVAYLQLLVPGATRGGQTGLAENPQGSLSYDSNGQPNGARSMTLDGVDNNENVLGGNVVIPTQESVREMKITTSSWDAEFGRVGGALTQIETRSGENDLHGSLFHFLRNDLANARNPFTEPTEPAPFKWNQFGGSVGGPIKRNKAFFFGDYQGQQQRRGSSVLGTVPTLRMRSGDLSEVLATNPIFDPTTGNPDGSGRTPFVGNIIPPNRISPIAQSLIELLPAPTFPNLTENNFIAVGSTKFNTHQASGRVDYFFSDNTRMFGRYIYFGSELSSPPLFGIEGGGPSLEGGVGGNSDGRNQNLSANLNHIFGPTLLTDLRYGYSHYRVAVLHPDNGLELANQVGIPDINQGDLNTSGLSTISVGGAGGFTMGGAGSCNCPLDQLMKHHQLASNTTWIRGTHTIKFGGDLRLYRNYRVTNANRRGSFGFTQGVTGSADVLRSGYGTASLMLGSAGSFSRQFNLQEDVGNESETHVFGYVQDSWKITPKLTLNYGVRCEIYTPPSTPSGAGSNFDFTTGEVVIAGVGDVSNRVNVRTDKNNFAPRLGLTYRLSDRTVLRLGAGRSFFPNVFNILISGNYPLIGTQQLTARNNFSPALNIADARPGFTFPEIPASGRFPLPSDIGITGNPYDRRMGYVDSWNITIQRQLTQSMSFETAYVGNVGRQLYWNLSLNRPIPGPGDFNPRRPLFEKFGFTQNIVWRGNSGSTNYHSWQTQFQRRIAQGLSLITSFTWQRTIDYGTYDNVTDPQNVRNDRGPADRNRTLVYSLGSVYDLPFGNGRQFLSSAHPVVEAALGGWSLSGIITAMSGRPFSVYYNNRASLNSDFRLRPDLIGDPTLDDPTRDRWYDVNAFAIPGPFRQGTMGRNVLAGPSYFEANLALSKFFSLSERARLEVRADTLNAFNNTNLGLPGNTVDSTAAGIITGYEAGSLPRQMQFGLRLTF